MAKYRLTLITEHQKSLEKAKKLADLICRALNCKNGYELSVYEKFENAYRIEITGQLENDKNSIEESIELTDRICSPWIVTYKRTDSTVELIFEKSEYSSFRRNQFNALNWAQFEIEND